MMKILQIDENYLHHDMIDEVIVDIVQDQKKIKQIEKQLNHQIPMKIQLIKLKQIMKKILQQVSCFSLSIIDSIDIFVFSS